MDTKKTEQKCFFPSIPKSIFIFVIAVIQLLGCQSYDNDYGCDEDEQTCINDVAVNTSKIINGNAVARGSLAELGIVRLSGCTGTLLTNRHVLTARHCVREWTSTGWATGTINSQWARLEGATVAEDQTIWSSRIFEPNTTTVDQGDYAILELTDPMEINGRTNDFHNVIFQGADSALPGTTLFCAGYGNNTEATEISPGVWTAGSGFGTLRSGNLTVASESGGALSTRRSATNQIGAPGDSGSTCFTNSDEVVGVQSTCYGPWHDINGDNTMQSREWTRIDGCVSASPGAHRAWSEARILADVNVDFTFSPPLSGATLNAKLVTPRGTENINVANSVTVADAAPRSNWATVEVNSEPARTMCASTKVTTPMSGTAQIHGWCMSDALVAAII